MTRKELVDRLYERQDGAVSRARISELLDQVFDELAEAIAAEGRMSIPNFGSFTVHVRNSRPGRHPKTGEAIQLPESSTVRFKPSAQLRDRLGP